jgi:hypothetical protein
VGGIEMNRVRIPRATLLVAVLALAALPAFPAELGEAKHVTSTTQFTVRSEVLNEARVVDWGIGF